MPMCIASWMGRADFSRPGSYKSLQIWPTEVGPTRGWKLGRWINASLAVIGLVFTPGLVLAQLSPPTVRSVRPLGTAPGATVALEVRAMNLDGTGAPALRFDDPRVRVEAVELAK